MKAPPGQRNAAPTGNGPGGRNRDHAARAAQVLVTVLGPVRPKILTLST